MPTATKSCIPYPHQATPQCLRCPHVCFSVSGACQQTKCIPPSALSPWLSQPQPTSGTDRPFQIKLLDGCARQAANLRRKSLPKSTERTAAHYLTPNRWTPRECGVISEWNLRKSKSLAQQAMDMRSPRRLQPCTTRLALYAAGGEFGPISGVFSFPKLANTIPKIEF